MAEKYNCFRIILFTPFSEIVEGNEFGMLSEYLAIFGMIIYHYHTKGGRRFGVFVNILVIGKQDFFVCFSP